MAFSFTNFGLLTRAEREVSEDFHKTSRLTMNTTFGSSTIERYSAKNMAKPVNFYCSAPPAQFVCLVGDFNGWNPLANPRHRQLDGCWFAQVQLLHGHHRYCFLVDGEPTLDPRGTGITRNERKGAGVSHRGELAWIERQGLAADSPGPAALQLSDDLPANSRPRSTCGVGPLWS